MRTRIIWTPLMDEYLLAKRRKRETFDEIGSALGVSAKAARNRYRRMFPDVTDPNYIPRRYRHSMETRAEVVRMRQQRVPLKVVAKKCGLSVNQVHGIWNHWRDYQAPRQAA